MHLPTTTVPVPHGQDPALDLAMLALFKAWVAGFTYSNNLTIMARLAQLETHLATQDEAIVQFRADVKVQLTELGVNLDNIAKDEAAVLAKLATMKDLSPENQAILDESLADLTAVNVKAKGIADALPDEPAA